VEVIEVKRRGREDVAAQNPALILKLAGGFGKRTLQAGA
jgi:hypothetical protein